MPIARVKPIIINVEIVFLLFTSSFIQYFKAKRPWQVLIGAVLEAIGAISMLVVYILYNVGVI